MNKIRYYHFRKINTRTAWMAPFISSRDGVGIASDCIDSYGGATVALTYSEEDDRWAYGVALCHIRDHYCKHNGRILAKHRAEAAFLAKHPLVFAAMMPEGWDIEEARAEYFLEIARELPIHPGYSPKMLFLIARSAPQGNLVCV